MKVLQVSDTFGPRGGVEQYMLAVAGLLTEAGHEVSFFYRRRQEADTEQQWTAFAIDDDQNVDVQVAERLQVLKPDVAFIHHVSDPHLITAVTARVPSVAYIHGFQAVCPGQAKYFRRGDSICERPFNWGCFPMHYLRRCSAARRPQTVYRLMRNAAALQDALQKVPRFLVATDYMRDLLAQNGFDSSRIALLPPHFFADGVADAYAPPHEPASLLFAGRLEIEKGLEYLLQALSFLQGNIRLLVAGDGTLRQRYEAISAELGLSQRVHFLGWQNTESLEVLYRRVGLVVIPSICPETFGKVGVEALAFGRPVIASRVGGIPDWLQDGTNGLLVPPANARALAQKVRQLVDHPARQQQMGKAGQSFIRGRYSAESHLARLHAAFAAVQTSYAPILA